MINEWKIEIYWERDMDGNNIELYAFEKNMSDNIWLYSWNNYIFSSWDSNVFLRDSLVIWIDACEKTRKNRLINRSPDIYSSKKDEFEKRISVWLDDISKYCHILVDNDRENESFSLKESFKLINDILMNQNVEEKYRWKIIRVVHENVQIWWQEKIFEYADRPPWVRLLITSWNKILLNFEKRIETKWGIDYRLPWWKVMDKIDDYIDFIENGWDIELEAKKTAKKELEEESNISLDLNDLSLLHRSHAGASIKWDLYYFKWEIPENQMTRKSIITQEGEEIQTWWYSFKEVRNMCLNWEIQEDRSVGIILKFILGSTSE